MNELTNPERCFCSPNGRNCTCRLEQLPISRGMSPVRLLDANERAVRAERLEILPGTGPVRLTEVRSTTVTRLSPPQSPQPTPGQPHGPDALLSTQFAMRYVLLFFHERRTDSSWRNPMEILLADTVACNSERSEIIDQSPHSF